jgi:hypothetical protein
MWIRNIRCETARMCSDLCAFPANVAIDLGFRHAENW